MLNVMYYFYTLSSSPTTIENHLTSNLLRIFFSVEMTMTDDFCDLRARVNLGVQPEPNRQI